MIHLSTDTTFMALNLKNPEAHLLAQKLAELRGTTLTDAVTSALRESLAAHRPGEPVELLLAEVEEIQRFVADLPDRDTRTPEEILGYDQTGLPT